MADQPGNESFPTSIPIPVADGGTGSATLGGDIATNNAHRTGNGSDHADVAANTTHRGAAAPHRSGWSGTWEAAPADTVEDVADFGADGTQVAKINVAPIGVAGTGTIAFALDIDGGGGNMLSAATYDLSGLSDNTATEMTLTGTTANLQGDAGTGIKITVTNTSVPLLVTITFGAQ